MPPCLSALKGCLDSVPMNMLQLLASPEVLRQLDLIFEILFQLNYPIIHERCLKKSMYLVNQVQTMLLLDNELKKNQNKTD